MTLERGVAISYLTGPEHSPWRWGEDGRVIVWFDGTTIAFREEIAEILDRLAPDGLPAFGAVVLLLAALKGKLPDAWWLGARRGETTKARVEKALDAIADVMSLSGRSVPALAEPSGKAALIRVLLEGEPQAIPRGDAAKLARELQVPPAEGELSALGSPGASLRILEDLEALGRGWQCFDPEAFELRLKTGLDRLPLAWDDGEETLPPCERARQLLCELENEAAFSGLAKLTRDLMAAIYFPHRLLPLDEAPSGGYSDVSNRGSLDRLLMSELAHDDLTLAVRVALNEALYVKREPPAEHPEGDLSILLDCGLRLWGVPRIFATAVALALIAVQSKKRGVIVYRARGSRIEEIPLVTREGLTEHLAAIEPELHPVRAVAAFADKLSEQEGSEGVIVTEADTVEDPELRAELRRLDLRSLYLASVTRSGRFRLVAYPAFGKPLSAAKLDLETIVPTKEGLGAARPPLLDPDFDPDLPVILGARPFPFLLPVRGKVDAVANLPSGEGACATRDGRLLHWEAKGLGARVVASSLPAGDSKLLTVTTSHIVLVKIHRQVARVTRVDRSTGELRTVEHELASELYDVLYQSDVVIFVHAQNAVAVDPRSGSTLSACETAGACRRGYVSGDPWRRLVWNGVALERVPVEIAGAQPEHLLWVFDSDVCEGPLALVQGEGIRASTGELLLHGDVAALSGASASGRRVACRTIDGSYVLFDLERRIVARQSEYEVSWLDARERYVPGHTMRSRILQVGTTKRGSLSILTPKAELLVHARGDGAIGVSEGRGDGQRRAFRPHPIPPRYGCELSVASWSDGTRVFLDSRGPLHFKSGDSRLDEVSLVLGEATVAAWSSDGTTCGPAFFFGERATSSAALLEKLGRILERAE